MKKCTKCQQLYADSLDVCPVCNTELQKCDDSSPMEKICKFLITKFYALSRRLKTIIVCVLLVITFILGFSLKSCTGIQKTDYDNALHRIDVLTENNNKITEEYDAYKSKMQPYEEQQKSDAKAAEEKAAAEKAAQEAEAKRQADEQAKNKANTETTNKTSTAGTSSATGIMPKNYNPTGKEPNWIEIISYCEVQMPKVIGYDASISLDENDTKIVRTGLRYKIETDSLKIKADKSYHKAIFIIEFENENYENYRVDTAEVDGIKIK